MTKHSNIFFYICEYYNIYIDTKNSITVANFSLLLSVQFYKYVAKYRIRKRPRSFEPGASILTQGNPHPKIAKNILKG